MQRSQNSAPRLCQALATPFKIAALGLLMFAAAVCAGAQSLSLGTAKLNGSGVATLSASSNGIAAGGYPITASYTGDSADNTSVSSAVTVTVK